MELQVVVWGPQGWHMQGEELKVCADGTYVWQAGHQGGTRLAPGLARAEGLTAVAEVELSGLLSR